VISLNNEIICPYCGSNKAGKLSPAGDADKFLIVSFSTKRNAVTDSGCTIDLYGCASCHKVWMEDDSINVGK